MKIKWLKIGNLQNVYIILKNIVYLNEIHLKLKAI